MAAEETATAAKAIRVFFIEKFSKVEKKEVRRFLPPHQPPYGEVATIEPEQSAHEYDRSSLLG
jgi:hypothetical protein